MLYFRDVKGLSVQEYWHYMKFWWPHNETIIATLPAYELTGDRKSAERHKQVHEWTFSHFSDSEYGRMVRLPAPQWNHINTSER